LGHSSHRHSDLWAITSYFNPANYRRRLDNFRVFRDKLSIPLVAVELSFDGKFQLSRDEADVLVQLYGGDVMWQKERLLNIGVRSVPQDCQAIAWVDCDVVFDNPGWANDTCRALEQFALIHLYTDIYNLRCDETFDPQSCRQQPATSRSIVHMMTSGEMTLSDLVGGYQVPFGATCGQAWASRRQVIAKHGFYDACVLGSGDRGFLCAAWGNFDAAIEYLRMNPRRAEHYLAWARPYFATVRGQVGNIPGRLFHLWHGDLDKRAYATRHETLEAFDFSPQSDIAIGPNGCWRWNSDKPEMHARVRDYFASRDEDGTGHEEISTLPPACPLTAITDNSLLDLPPAGADPT
jgi:hypothetical protein